VNFRLENLGGEGSTYIRATNTTRKLITSLSSINLRCFFIHHPLANVPYSSVIQFSKELLFFFLLPLFFLRFTLACIPGSFKDDRNITSKSYDLHTKIERENVKFDKESLPKKDA
jgi:hypothetical protein